MGYKKIMLYAILLAGVVLLSGCQSVKTTEPVVTIPRYEKMEYETITVNRQDVTPEITLDLHVGDYKTYNYMAQLEDLKLDSLKVAVGDRVKKGDTLITFRSEELSKQLQECEEELSSGRLRLKHLKNLAAIDKEADYNKEIKELKEDMGIVSLRIQEIKEQLSSYSIIARADGTITFVDEGLSLGQVKEDAPLLIETCGSEEYEAVCEEKHTFVVGDIFSARLGVASYKMKVTSVTREEEGTRIRFLPMEDMSGVSTSDTLVMTVEKNILKQVITVPVQAIFTKEEKSFVKLKDENGFLDVRRVTVGSEVPGTDPKCYVIEEGLAGGEQVVIP